jgi:16S rRNA G966 N2-methylase RsmD
MADPPYDDGGAWEAIAATVESALAPGAMVVVEHAARMPSPETLAGLPRWRDRRQGDGAMAVYRAVHVEPEPAGARPAGEDVE